MSADSNGLANTAHELAEQARSADNAAVKDLLLKEATLNALLAIFVELREGNEQGRDVPKVIHMLKETMDEILNVLRSSQ